ncbi:MAG: hypothetical protein SXA11_18055 [Cyanobacteriota bacterium]|nr:hypothetical protein [Cyanobacteriota bacterium]
MPSNPVTFSPLLRATFLPKASSMIIKFAPCFRAKLIAAFSPASIISKSLSAGTVTSSIIIHLGGVLIQFLTRIGDRSSDNSSRTIRGMRT